MKITYLFTGFGNSGGCIVLYNFMDKLSERGYEIYAVTPEEKIKWKPRIGRAFLKKKSILSGNIFEKFNMVVKKIGLKNKFEILAEIRQLTSSLLKNWVESDITISTSCLTSYANYYLSGRSRSFYHMQHYEELFYRDRLSQLAARSTYYLPLTLIANSSWLQESIKEYFNRESYLLCPGIDLNVFNPYVNPSRKYFSKKEWTIVTYAGSVEWKGFADAEKVIKRVRNLLIDEGVNINWKVFGFLKGIKNRHKQNFEFVGQIFNENLAKFYSESDIVLCPSWYESFPLPPIEAMACGTFVVTSKLGTEDYAFDGKNSFVTKPRDIEGMADKIVFAIRNPKLLNSYVGNGIEVSKRFNWEERADILENILKNTESDIEKNKTIEYKINKLLTGSF